jgi:hypothetical protein
VDWDRAIAINQAALARIVAALLAMVGLQGGVMPARLERPVYRAVLKVLRPAESAARRLIVIVARGLVVKTRPSRPMPKGLSRSAAGGTSPSFQLFDARKRFVTKAIRRGPEPRITFFAARGPLVPIFQTRAPLIQARMETGAAAEPDDGMVGAARLGRRLAALKGALENLPVQAKRLVRWQARRERMASPKFRSPLRPGRPPGYREKPRDEVDLVLRECHALASGALNDSS